MQERKIKLVFSYRGTAYHGFQRQRVLPSVQEEMEKVLKRLVGHEAPLAVSGRTDAGVHARYQTAHFITTSNIPGERFVQAMNTFLPEDIVVLESKEMPFDFHARYDVVEKTYRYRILNQRQADPFLLDRAYWVRVPLRIEQMRAAAEHLIGTHDFTSFCSVRTHVDSKVRTIYEIRIDVEEREPYVKGQGQDIWLTFRGSGFLYNMVRMLTGALLEVGKGRWTPEYVKEMLASKSPSVRKVNVPPQGLYLWDVRYKE